MESLHYLLMKSHTVLHRRIAAEASRAGLSSGQPKILEYLWLYGDKNQKAIAEYCEIEQTTVGSILLRMEKAGLISRGIRNGDRRSLYVSLTDKGREAAEQMAEIFEEQEKKACRDMSEQEIRQLRELLSEFCRSVNGKKAGEPDEE